jgi:hypothetical protein
MTTRIDIFELKQLRNRFLRFLRCPAKDVALHATPLFEGLELFPVFTSMERSVRNFSCHKASKDTTLQATSHNFLPSRL